MFTGLYNLKYFSAAVLLFLIFKTPFLNKPWNEIGASELCCFHNNWKQLYQIEQ
jgi:hypothetical protein